jgi:hypothetical protein
VTPPRRDADDGPQRFVRNWLRFDEQAPQRVRTLWKLLATVTMLLAVSGLLAIASGLLHR